MRSDRFDTRAGEPARRTSLAADHLHGRLLDGRYRIGSRIARGGMATVYEATDLRLERTIAIKVMHAGLGDDHDFAARFVSEARAAARLSHPNVVSVFDQGEDAGVVYLAMELVSGHTLRDVISKESPMPPARALALLEPVVSALASAHRKGVVHRDVKPENVLISDDGHIKVADFGLAKAVSATTKHTATGVMIGTVSYVAPEIVVEGRSDARADVYAVGVMLYELLTGSKPHDGETAIQVAYQHVHRDVPPPSAVVPGIPAYVDALVARATARDREQRPADAGVLLHQLHRVANAVRAGVTDDADLVSDLQPRRSFPGEESPGDVDTAPTAVARGAHALATPAPRPEHTTAWVGQPAAGHGRRRRGPLLLVLALLLAVAVGGGAYWLGFARYTSTPSVLGLTETQAVAELEGAGLEATAGEPAYSSTVPAGRVISTDPGAGDRVLDGGAVTFVVSLGEEVYDLPVLAGMTEDQAQDAIAATHMTFGESVERWSEKVPEGTVIASNPAAGATLRPGAVVDLVVSKGRRPIRVGDWVDRSAERAEAALAKRGLKTQVTEEHHDDVPEGAVIAQEPRDGTLHKGDTVKLVVSLGPELVEVPGGLVASGVEAARQRLEDAGFEVRTDRAPTYLGLGYVFSVSPKSGTMVPKGSTITLNLI